VEPAGEHPLPVSPPLLVEPHDAVVAAVVVVVIADVGDDGHHPAADQATEQAGGEHRQRHRAHQHAEAPGP